MPPQVLIAACDTFRAGAVEQLKTHCTRLGVPLYERGYEKDPAKVVGWLGRLLVGSGGRWLVEVVGCFRRWAQAWHGARGTYYDVQHMGCYTTLACFTICLGPF